MWLGEALCGGGWSGWVGNWEGVGGVGGWVIAREWVEGHCKGWVEWVS